MFNGFQEPDVKSADDAAGTADLDQDSIGDIPCLVAVRGKGGSATVTPPHPALARGRGRHVGDPVALVVAETPSWSRSTTTTCR